MLAVGFKDDRVLLAAIHTKCAPSPPLMTAAAAVRTVRSPGSQVQPRRPFVDGFIKDVKRPG